MVPSDIEGAFDKKAEAQEKVLKKSYFCHMLPRNIKGSETFLFDLPKYLLLGILSKSSFLGSGWGRIKSKIVEKHMQATLLRRFQG